MTTEHKTKLSSNGLGELLNGAVMHLMLKDMDVAEVYSPPRVVEVTKAMGLRGCWSLGFIIRDENGRAWGFNKAEMGNNAVRKVIGDKPGLSIDIPICTFFSQMNYANHMGMSPVEVHQRLDHGRKHLEFCAKLYDMQWREGRHFPHEHPRVASPWQVGCTKKLMERTGVQRVVGDHCMYGLTAKEGERWGPARKNTDFMTNSLCIAQALSQRCPNKRNHQVHEHVKPEGGRTKAAQVYPPGLCRAICQGFMAQMEADRRGAIPIGRVGDECNGKR